MKPVAAPPVAKVIRGMTASEVVQVMGLPEKVLLQGTAEHPMQRWIYRAEGDSTPEVVFYRGAVLRAGISMSVLMPAANMGLGE